MFKSILKTMGITTLKQIVLFIKKLNEIATRIIPYHTNVEKILKNVLNLTISFLTQTEWEMIEY